MHALAYACSLYTARVHKLPMYVHMYLCVCMLIIYRTSTQAACVSTYVSVHMYLCRIHHNVRVRNIRVCMLTCTFALQALGTDNLLNYEESTSKC